MGSILSQKEPSDEAGTVQTRLNLDATGPALADTSPSATDGWMRLLNEDLRRCGQAYAAVAASDPRHESLRREGLSMGRAYRALAYFVMDCEGYHAGRNSRL
jgi:hypothetical protein